MAVNLDVHEWMSRVGRKIMALQRVRGDSVFTAGVVLLQDNLCAKMLLAIPEKDVEAMLLRSADFYAKASMWDRAMSVYRNFIRRYPPLSAFIRG